MQVLRLAIFLGQLSQFGQAAFRALRRLPGWQLTEVVVASDQHWQQFYERIYRTPQRLPTTKHLNRRLKKWLRQHVPSASFRVLSTTDAPFFPKGDFALSLGFPVLFSAPWLTIAQGRLLNVHPSYLPRCRGANPTYWTVAQGEPYGGISTHEVIAQLDAGPIWQRDRIDFDWAEITDRTLRQLVQQQLPLHFSALLQQLRSGSTPQPQEADRASYFYQDRAADHLVSWKKLPLRKIDAKVRAGKAFSFTADQQRVAWQAPIGKQRCFTGLINDITVGQVLRVRQQSVLVQALDGSILLQAASDPLTLRQRFYRKVGVGKQHPLIKGTQLL